MVIICSPSAYAAVSVGAGIVCKVLVGIAWCMYKNRKDVRLCV